MISELDCNEDLGMAPNSGKVSIAPGRSEEATAVTACRRRTFASISGLPHRQPPDYVSGGAPGFEYAGFSFMIVDPWPENWSKNWYSTDDVYISCSSGYYLYNRKYPHMAIAIIAL